MKLYDKTGNALLEEVEVMDTFLGRLRGLMFRKSIPSDYGVIISPCNSIHTFFMKFAIAVVYLDKDNKVIRGPDVMKPGKAGPFVKGAFKVLEYDPGNTSVNLKVGDELFLGEK